MEQIHCTSEWEAMMEFEQRRAEKASAMRLSRQMLFWAAAFSSLWGALYLLGLTGRLMIDGSLHSISSAAVQSISAAVALLWNVSLLIMFTALRRQSGFSRPRGPGRVGRPGI
jgi:uncharacterized membrane protein